MKKILDATTKRSMLPYCFLVIVCWGHNGPQLEFP